MLHLEHNICGAEIRLIRKVDRNYVNKRWQSKAHWTGHI